MVELIFVIVVIGVLSSVAIPKFLGMKDGAKKTAEKAAFTALSTAIQTAHGEWSINEGEFTWGRHRPSSELNSTDSSGDKTGYPTTLGSSDDNPFNFVIKKSKKFKKVGGDDEISIFTGPASGTNGVDHTDENSQQDIPNKPDKNDYWVYVFGIDSDKNCTIGENVLYLGDISLIDISGTGSRPATIVCE